MTERERFLERWSRKKREAVDEPAPAKPQDAEAEKNPNVAPPAVRADAEKPLDLESLPSLDSIAAETDIRSFLQPGVPTDLRREALRRAWSADPGIRDFIGLAENSGDFNDPTAMAGFGPIAPSEVARLMAQFVLTPEEKKVARAPETLTDQHDGKSDAASESDAASRADPTGDAKDKPDTHVALQKDEADSESADQPTEPVADSKFQNS